MKLIRLILAAGAAMFMTLSCEGSGDSVGVIDVPVKPGGEEDTGKTLKDASYPIGCAINFGTLNSDKTYRDVITGEFSSITPGNEMKLTYMLKNGVYHPETGKWSLTIDYTDADQIVNFAKANGLRIHGHTLVWFKKVPDCLLQYDDVSGERKNREIWVSFLEQYISEVAGHFRGKVASWDVVNEALADNIGSDTDWTKMRDSDKWFTNIGEDYIALSFRLADETDPDALLFYNDYGTEYLYYKRIAQQKMAQQMAKDGVPIDGIGLQTHTDITADPERFDERNNMTQLEGRILNLERTIENVVETCGLMVHVSEIDVKICAENQEIDYADSDDQLKRLEYQTEVFRAVAEKLKSCPADKVFGMTTWGVGDTGSYGQQYKTLLFDANYEKKPAYYGVFETFYPEI